MHTSAATAAELSLTGKRWILPPDVRARSGAETLLRLSADRDIDLAISNGGIVLPVIPDMERAIVRIQEALQTGQRIGIFGDYDCDGVTAVAQLVRMLERRGVEFSLSQSARTKTQGWVRLPDRVRDGYGLSSAIAQEVCDAGIELLITADTGITAIEEITELKKRGIDTIITDHHRPREELPPAYAIVHPDLGSSGGPHPSGSGVVHYLIRAMEEKPWLGIDTDTALAMMGTVADLVELRGGNRALVIEGLAALERIANSPIAELRDRCKKNSAAMTATDIAFRMAPRINAAGRMQSPDIALRALLFGGSDMQSLDTFNEERQTMTKSLFAQVLAGINTSSPPALLSCISGDYPHGIVGLLAGKLTEAFGKPSLIAHTDGTMCTASLRSPSLYNITEGLVRCSDLLESFGGHAQAAGCRFAQEHYEAIVYRLTEDIDTRIAPELLVPTIAVDCLLDPREITVTFCEKLRLLEPFGQGNREPVFLLQHVSLHDVRACGRDSVHLQARICGIKSIGFGLASSLLQSSNPQPLDVLVTVAEDEWNGRCEPQLSIKDIRSCFVA